MKFIISFLIFIFSIQSAADCRPDYDNYQKGILALRNTSIGVTLGQSGIMMATSMIKETGRLGVVLNGLLNKRGYWILYVGASAGAYISQFKLSHSKIKALLEQSYLGKGNILSETAVDLNVSEALLAATIIQLNETSQFCIRTITGNNKEILISDLKSDDEAMRLIEQQVTLSR